MNAGFSNLTTLKAHLLAASLRAATDYDAAITNIGLGMAAAIGNFCNRKFDRVVGDTEIIAADRCQFLLSRYPVEAVTQVEIKSTEALGWVVQNPSPIQTFDPACGIVYFPEQADAGKYYEQVRFTFTAGYFWEQLEPGDGGYPTAPVGAALPPDLKLAWLLQCEIVWKMRDKLGQQIGGEESKGGGPTYQINDLDLAPQVKQMLQQFVRYNLV